MNRLESLKQTNLVVSVGSIDGILTTAALLRWLGKDETECDLHFCQAFTVDKLPVDEWSGRHVCLVDLAVNNRDTEMTRSFVEQLRANDNSLVAVIDEHSREDWLEVLGSFDGLVVEPQSQDAGDDAPKSSGEVLRRALTEAREECNEHMAELLAAADAGDRMDFTTHFGSIANQAVKSNIRDDSRRVKLARHLAFHREPDEEIRGWIGEYEKILANHDTVVAGRQDLGHGIHRVSALSLAVDMTSLMARLYRDGARVVFLEGEMFSKVVGGKTVLIAIGTRDRSLDLMGVIRDAGIEPHGGFAQKVNIHPEDEAKAFSVVLGLIS